MTRLRRSILFWLFPFAAAVMGCASPSKTVQPGLDMNVPANWSGASPGRVTDPGGGDWWRSFEDTTLNGIIGESLKNNYDIKMSAARVDAAAAVARITGADMLPALNANFNVSRRRQNIIGIPVPGFGSIITSRTNSFGVSLDTRWEIDLWGKIRSSKSAALADLEASWADLAATRLSIVGQTAKAYFALMEAEMQMNLAAETVGNYELSAGQVRKRYNSGLRNALDLHLALAGLAGAKSLLEARRTQLDRARRQLEILLGRYPAGIISASGGLPSINGGVPTALPSELLVRRPDLLASERRYAAASKRVSSAKRAFFPVISLTAAGGTLSDQLSDLLKGDFSVWSIAAGVTQPLFQGGRLRANLSQTDAVRDQALAAYALALLSAFGEVESALFAENALAKQEAAARAAAEESEAARKLAEKQYREGLIDYITVLESQRGGLNSRSEWIAIRRSRLDARVNLHLSLGGGFELGREWRSFLASITNSRTEDTVE